MKKMLACILALTLALCLAGAACAEGYKVALVNYSVGNSWRAQMVAEFEAEAKRLQEEGVISEYYITNSNDDISKEISDVEDMITKGVDAIVITAASPTALAPAVEEATEAGIKVVSFDNVVDTDMQVATVGIDEKEFGRINAEFLVEALDGKGKIIVLNGTAGTTTDSLRWKAPRKSLPSIRKSKSSVPPMRTGTMPRARLPWNPCFPPIRKLTACGPRAAR